MIYARSGRLVNCAARTLKFDQLDVIYAGPGRSVNCAARTSNLRARCDLCWAGQVSELGNPDFEILLVRCYLCWAGQVSELHRLDFEI